MSPIVIGELCHDYSIAHPLLALHVSELLLCESNWKFLFLGSADDEVASTFSPVTTPRNPDQKPPKPPPRGRPDRPGTPSPPERYGPDICQGNFDSVTVLRGEMFVFKVSAKPIA